MAGVASRQGSLTPSKHLIPLLVYPKVLVCPTIQFAFYLGIMRLTTVKIIFVFSYTFWQRVPLEHRSSQVAILYLQMHLLKETSQTLFYVYFIIFTFATVSSYITL
jgi:hypothetical protein